jgi:hypothetical protein
MKTIYLNNEQYEAVVMSLFGTMYPSFEFYTEVKNYGKFRFIRGTFALKEEKKMTRNEAIAASMKACIPKHGWSEVNRQAVEDLVSTLEALGLLKFKEEKNEETIFVKNPGGALSQIYLDEAIKVLQEKGYKVTNG